MLQPLARLHLYPFPSCWGAPHSFIKPKMSNFAKNSQFCSKGLIFLYCCSSWQVYSPSLLSSSSPLYQVPRHHCTATLKRGAGGGGRGEEEKLCLSSEKVFLSHFEVRHAKHQYMWMGRVRKKGDWSARCVLTSSSYILYRARRTSYRPQPIDTNNASGTRKAISWRGENILGHL